jgi:hypothetical protein
MTHFSVLSESVRNAVNCRIIDKMPGVPVLKGFSAPESRRNLRNACGTQVQSRAVLLNYCVVLSMAGDVDYRMVRTMAHNDVSMRWNLVAQNSLA